MANIVGWRELLEGSANPLYASVTSLAAGATTSTITPASGKLAFCTGFEITGMGATAGSGVAVTLTGTGTTLNFTMGVPAGVTAPCVPLVVEFSPPIAASAKDVAFVLTVPTFGAGNVAASTTLHGFQV